MNRRITSDIDYILDILDPSKKAFEHVKRVRRIINEINIKFEFFYLIGGYNYSNQLAKRAEETGLKYLGKIDYDKNLEYFVSEGKSLLELPDASPAYSSIKRIMGYIG